MSNRRSGQQDDLADGPADSAASDAETRRKSTKSVPAHKTQITTYIRKDVAELARNAEYGLRSNPEAPDNWSEYVDEALAHYTRYVERKWNGGKRFAERRKR